MSLLNGAKVFHDAEAAMFSSNILTFKVNINCFTYINCPIIFHLRENLWTFKCQSIYQSVVHDLVFRLSFYDLLILTDGDLQHMRVNRP